MEQECIKCQHRAQTMKRDSRVFSVCGRKDMLNFPASLNRKMGFVHLWCCFTVYTKLQQQMGNLIQILARPHTNGMISRVLLGMAHSRRSSKLFSGSSTASSLRINSGYFQVLLVNTTNVHPVNTILGGVWWLLTVIPPFRKPSQQECEFDRQHPFFATNKQTKSWATVSKLLYNS